MSLDKVVRILKRLAVGKPGKVEVFGLEPGVVGVCITGMEQREKDSLFRAMQLEAGEYSYRVIEVWDV